MNQVIGISALFCAALFVMAWVPAAKERSVVRFLVAGFVSFFAVAFPLLIFIVSSIPFVWTPDSKDECSHGWLDCWMGPKLMLIPFALWASAALYRTDVLRIKEQAPPWVISGIFLGVLISVISLIYVAVMSMGQPIGDVTIRDAMIVAVMILLVPGYVAIWYSIRAVKLAKAEHFPVRTYFIPALITLPFWAMSVLSARSIYAGLPQSVPEGCFVVTAASRGHKSFVGPFYKISRNGRVRRANRQLLTLWEFEARWQSAFPRSHASFRRLYNRIGPVVAAQIRWPWVADVVWLALKPVEWVAGVVNEAKLQGPTSKLQTKRLIRGTFA